MNAIRVETRVAITGDGLFIEHGGGSVFGELEQRILAALQAIFDQFGWVGVAGLMGFENATGITPSEIILGLAGWFLVAAHGLPFTYVLVGGLYAAVGSALGASITYWVARLGGRPVIDRTAGWVRVRPQQIDQAAGLFQRWGTKLVLFGRLIPGIRTLISIPAGMSRMPYAQFLLATFVGSYVWCTVLIGLGYLMGNEWEQVSGMIREYGLIVAVSVSVAGALALVWYWRRMNQAGVEPEPARIDDERG